jgi:hypothetical protein
MIYTNRWYAIGIEIIHIPISFNIYGYPVSSWKSVWISVTNKTSVGCDLFRTAIRGKCSYEETPCIWIIE